MSRSPAEWDRLMSRNLNYMLHEWKNWHDHSSDEWLADEIRRRHEGDRKRMEKGQPLQGEFGADDIYQSRNHAQLVREAWWFHHNRDWWDVMVDCLSGGIEREADNPLWTGAMVTVFDRRPIPHGLLEDILRIGGHSNRMFWRGGIIWGVAHKKLGAKQDSGLAELRKQWFISVSAFGKFIFGRGRVIHVDGPADDYEKMALYESLLKPFAPTSLLGKLPNWVPIARRK